MPRPDVTAAPRTPPRNVPVVGLTGGIGSGKSTVGQLFAAQGIQCVDTDAISRELTAAGGQAMAAIRQHFGAHLLDAQGALDRAAMRQLVFSNTAARRELEAILHPLIRAEVEHRLTSAPPPYTILEVPLLVESPQLQARCQRILVVDCTPEQQRQRVMARSGLSAAEADRIIAAQADRQSRLAIASDVICNGGSMAQLEHAVASLHQFYVLEFTGEKSGCYDAAACSNKPGEQDQ